MRIIALLLIALAIGGWSHGGSGGSGAFLIISAGNFLLDSGSAKLTAN